MGKHGPTGLDIANFGVDLYQSRQIRKMHKDMEEATNTIQLQMLQMQMAQEEERQKKEMIVLFRKLVLELEEELTRIENIFQEYPAHSAISFDMIKNTYEQSPMSSDYFEEFQDIERTKKMENKLKFLESFIENNLTIEQHDIKNKMIHYMASEPELESAIEKAELYEKTTNEIELCEQNIKQLEEEKKSTMGEWENKQAAISERKSKFKTMSSITIFSGLLTALGLIAFNAFFPFLEDSEIQTYLGYIIYATSGLPAIYFVGLLSSPIIPSNDRLVTLRKELLAQKILSRELTFSLDEPYFDGLSNSEELREMKKDRFDFVDKNSPKPGEVFATNNSLENKRSDSVPKTLPAGPPRKPPSNLKGGIDESGIEWLEYPENSDRWFTRSENGKEWVRWTE